VKKQAYQVIGKSLPRSDAYDKVTGKARYTVDVEVPGMLHAKVLRSPYPHAKVVRIDVDRAKSLPGVAGIVTWENTPRVLFNATSTHTQSPPPFEAVKDQYIFDNKVRYVGDEVAAVAATSPEIAEEAIRLIKVDYKILPAVMTVEEAEETSAPRIHEDKNNSNMIGSPIENNMGDIQEGFKCSAHTVECTYTFPVQKQCQLEPQAALAMKAEDGRMMVYSTTQAPHPTRKILSDIFSLPMNQIRVANPPYVGGAFGVRIGFSAKAEPIAVALALLTEKPVKIVYSRDEDFIASETRHAGTIRVKLGFSDDGIIQAADVESRMNGGAYASWSVDVNGAINSRALTIYRIPHLHFHGYSVYTNTTLAGAARGFGAPAPTYAMEMTVDKAARTLNMDPIAFRLKNIIQVGDAWSAPFPCRSTGLKECMERGKKRIGWDDFSKKSYDSNHPRYLRGVGMAVGNHISSAFPFQTDYTGANVYVLPDGSVQVETALVEMGTGVKTTLGQIAAEVLGVPMESVWVKIGDTDSSYDIGGQASRSLYAGGSAVKKAAEAVREQILAYVALKQDCTVDNLDLRDGWIWVHNEKAMPFSEMTQDADYHNVQFSRLEKHKTDNALSWHAHFARIKIDTWTGKIFVEKLVAAHDMGKAINPQIVEGVIEGGVSMGIGYALSEEITYDHHGKQIQDSYHKYMLPTSMDYGEIEPIIVEAHEPSGPFGARGIGENSVAAVAPAIMCAVRNLLGIDVTELPLTPERLLKQIALNK